MDPTTRSEADSGADEGFDDDAVDGFDEVFGSAISNAVRRAVDVVGRSPLASLEDPTDPAPPAPEAATDSELVAEPTPPPLSMTDVTDPYELLGVNRRAPWPEITAAYKRRARAWHPDGAPEGERGRREELIRDLNAAYSELRVRRGK